MSDQVSQFVAGLDALAAAPGRRGPLVIYQVDVLAGQHAGQAIETAVEAIKIGVPPRRVRLILNHSTTHAMDIDTASGVLGRRPDFVIQRSESLDRAANHGRPLVTSDPTDPLVADLKLLAESIAASMPAEALDRLDA